MSRSTTARSPPSARAWRSRSNTKDNQHVIARSRVAATKQSRATRVALDCFAALAMTLRLKSAIGGADNLFKARPCGPLGRRGGSRTSTREDDDGQLAQRARTAPGRGGRNG